MPAIGLPNGQPLDGGIDQNGR
ncbi:hypothetical protein ACTIVE_1691 [Actinomadura verrucosospora]|uniref:Uncharacterized protein n=1 Tax=Actinomadura verrucosospora TaxID=46165 RepID=A0A7D3VQ18_ACTVE|nr:hypothetical protein ACTIVE_1691 [Actinomadura verrucosospora]